MKLKSCPFCGGEANVEPFETRKGFDCNIMCSGCLAIMQSITYDTEEEAVRKASEAWNRRANDDRP